MESCFILQQILWAGHRLNSIKELFAKIYFSTKIPAAPLKIWVLNKTSAYLIFLVGSYNCIIYSTVCLKALYEDIWWVVNSYIHTHIRKSHCRQFTEQVSKSWLELKVHQWEQPFLIRRPVPLAFWEGLGSPNWKSPSRNLLVFLKCVQSLERLKAVLWCHGKKNKFIGNFSWKSSPALPTPPNSPVWDPVQNTASLIINFRTLVL